MTWQGIQGHDPVAERFQRAIERGRLAGSFLFIGPSGIGKRMFAFALAKGLLCKKNGDRSIEPCGQCESCRLFLHTSVEATDSEEIPETHPDLYYVCKPPDKSRLPLELLIGDKEHRGRSGLCYNISKTPYLGHRKVAIIDDADFFNDEGANAMLKTLEEPPPDSILILIGTSTSKQLPTIRSRCQIIRFSPLSPQLLASILVQQGVVETMEQGLKLARRAGGSMDQAKELIDDDIEQIRTELAKHLSARNWNSVAMAIRLNAFVDDAGKEAVLRRRRLRLLFNSTIDFLRDVLKKNENPLPEENAQILEKHQNTAREATRRLERTLDALEQVDRNANLPFVLDAWCADMG